MDANVTEVCARTFVVCYLLFQADYNSINLFYWQLIARDAMRIHQKFPSDILASSDVTYLITSPIKLIYIYKTKSMNVSKDLKGSNKKKVSYF